MGAPGLALPARLSRATRLLHWAVALGIVGMLGYGFWLQTLPGGAGKTGSVQLHKSFGMLVFATALARLLWRLREGFPAAVHRRPFERGAARALHVFLIAATLAMPLTGIGRSLAYARPVSVFGWPVIPRLFAEKQETLYAVCAGIHDWLALALAAAIGLHAAAALKHHLVDRDDTLRRMLPSAGGGR